MSKSPNRFVPSGKLKALELREGSSIPVSNALSGRIRYNEVTNHLELSENTGAFASILGTEHGIITLTPLGGGADDAPQIAAAVASGKIVILAAGTWNRGGVVRTSTHAVMFDPSSGVHNVEFYGAVGDGVTDDLVAIQAADTACPAGGTVAFPVPPSFYLVHGQITPSHSGKRYIGLGPAQVRIHQDSFADHLFAADNLDNLQWENLWLTGGGPGGGDGIHLQNTGTNGRHHVFRNMKIGSSGAIYGFNTGVWLRQCPQPRFEGGEIWQCGTAIKLLGSCNAGVIDGVELIANIEAGLHLIADNLGGTLYPVVGVNVRGCTFQQNTVCAVRAEDVNGNLIDGCYFEQQGAYLAAVTLDNLVWTAQVGPVLATCVRPAGSWLAAFLRPGMLVNVSGSDLNNGNWRLFSVTASTMTFVTGSAVVDDADDDSVTVSPSGWDVVIDDGLQGASTIHYGNTVRGNNFRGSTVLSPLYRGAVNVVNGQSNRLAQNLHTDVSSVRIEASAPRTEVDRTLRLNTAAFEDYSTDLVSGPAMTYGVARPTTNIALGDMHFDTSLVTPRTVWLKSIGPDVWVDSLGAVV
jgi:hypothetical protein